MKSEIEFEVPFFDVDSMRVTYHANYIKYMELGRCDLMKKLNIGYYEMEEKGYLLPIVTLNTKYIRPSFYGQRLRMVTETVDSENFIILKYTLFDAKTGEKIFKGETKQMIVDKNTLHSMFKLPDEIYEKIKG